MDIQVTLSLVHKKINTFVTGIYIHFWPLNSFYIVAGEFFVSAKCYWKNGTKTRFETTCFTWESLWEQNVYIYRKTDAFYAQNNCLQHKMKSYITVFISND